MPALPAVLRNRYAAMAHMRLALCTRSAQPCAAALRYTRHDKAQRDRHVCRRRRAGLPPLPDEELARAIRRLKFGSAALAVVPSSMSLSANATWAAPARQGTKSDGTVRYASRYEVTPEQRALERRQFALGMRTAAYGTAVALLCMSGAATGVAWRYDLRNWDDCRVALHAWGQSWRPRMQAAMLPWRDYMRSFVRDAPDD
jgi:hypothetical protein